MTDQLAGLLQRISAEMVGVVPQFTWSSVVDIALVALILYGLFRLFQGTQAVALLRGILVLALVFLLAASRLTAFGWLLRNSALIIMVAIPVIFQPELRRALERLGRSAPVSDGTQQPRDGRTTGDSRGDTCGGDPRA